MADGTKIEWTDATWNPIVGCSVVSTGCKHCYAMRLAGTRLRHHPTRKGLTTATKAGPVWNGQIRFNDAEMVKPLSWRKPRRIFVCAHGDLFHEAVPDEWVDRVFAVMALCPQHTFQVLTKRPERARVYLRNDDRAREAAIDQALAAIIGDPLKTFNASPFGGCRPGLPLPNVWLGVSVEDQPTADMRIPILLAAAAAIRWISAEPLLGPVDLTQIDDGVRGGVHLHFDALTGVANDGHQSIIGVFGQPDPKLDWVVAGGESGPGARPAHPDWFRSLRNQCADACVPFLFKQWGDWVDVTGVNPMPPASAECVFTARGKVLGAGGRMNGRFTRGTIEPGWRGRGGAWMARVGKKAAGRLLDGKLHDAFPQVRP